MLYLIIGFAIGAIGIALINSLNEIIAALTEWIKAAIGVKVTKCNVDMNKLVKDSEDESPVRAIGFATNFEEDENNDQ